MYLQLNVIYSQSFYLNYIYFIYTYFIPSYRILSLAAISHTIIVVSAIYYYYYYYYNTHSQSTIISLYAKITLIVRTERLVGKCKCLVDVFLSFVFYVTCTPYNHFCAPPHPPIPPPVHPSRQPIYTTVYRNLCIPYVQTVGQTTGRATFFNYCLCFVQNVRKNIIYIYISINNNIL